MAEAQKPQKPMAFEQYVKGLKQDYEVMRLRSGIAEFMFKEKMAMHQLEQLHAARQQSLQQVQGDSEQPSPTQDELVPIDLDPIPSEVSEEVEA